VALRARQRGLDRANKPLDLVRQGGVDEESELAWLTAVAKAWSSPLVARYAAGNHGRAAGHVLIR